MMYRTMRLVLAVLLVAGMGCNPSGSSSSSPSTNSTTTGSSTSTNSGNSGTNTTTSGLMINPNVPRGALPHSHTTPVSKGALQGKTIVLSPGHGLMKKTSGWVFQRPYLYNLIEDIHDNEIPMDYLMPYLYRAGAYVFSTRERSRQSNEVIVDNDSSSGYTETGSWSTSSSSGYQNGTYRYTTTATTESATATFQPTIPENGHYPIYIWYRASSNRPTDALFRVQHTGGTTDFRINQTKNGNRWLFIGDFYFEKGTSGAVVVSNQSSTPGKAVIVDAIRFGGGVGPTGKPRWREGAKIWIPFIGATHLDAYGEVTIRGHYADWQGGDLFMMIHTNAGGGTGTSTFIHNTNPSAGSAAYQDKVHDQLISDFRALVDPNWKNRGQHTGNYGELRTTNTMPALLVELAFHDLEEDAKHIQRESWRHIAGRALFKGMFRYLAPSQAIPPLAPTHLRAQNSGPGQVKVSWQDYLDPTEPTAVATSHVVYTSVNGRGFDNGVEVTGNSATIKNLTPGAVYYFRVSAANNSGLSLPTETIAVRVTPNGESADVLIVNGFDRRGKRFAYQKNSANRRNYTIDHGTSIARAGYYFDGASNEAVEDGHIDLKDFHIVDWILGEESTVDETFSAKEQQKVQAYLNGGGSLLVSGSEIGWDLDAKGSSSDRSFYKGFLKADYLADDAKTYSAVSVGGSALDGISGTIEFDDGDGNNYNVDYPDVLQPEGGAAPCLQYAGGAVAGIQYSGTFKVIYLAFPIEAIKSQSTRDEVVKKAMKFLE